MYPENNRPRKKGQAARHVKLRAYEFLARLEGAIADDPRVADFVAELVQRKVESIIAYDTEGGGGLVVWDPPSLPTIARVLRQALNRK
jgi:hypothetical protein